MYILFDFTRQIELQKSRVRKSRNGVENHLITMTFQNSNKPGIYLSQHDTPSYCYTKLLCICIYNCI